VLQCVIACCGVLQCVALSKWALYIPWRGVLQCVTVCCSVLRSANELYRFRDIGCVVAVCCSVLHSVNEHHIFHGVACCIVLYCVVACCSVWHSVNEPIYSVAWCVAACCVCCTQQMSLIYSVAWWVAVCCSVLRVLHSAMESHIFSQTYLWIPQNRPKYSQKIPVVYCSREPCATHCVLQCVALCRSLRTMGWLRLVGSLKL